LVSVRKRGADAAVPQLQKKKKKRKKRGAGEKKDHADRLSLGGKGKMGTWQPHHRKTKGLSRIENKKGKGRS